MFTATKGKFSRPGEGNVYAKAKDITMQGMVGITMAAAGDGAASASD